MKLSVQLAVVIFCKIQTKISVYLAVKTEMNNLKQICI